MSLNHHCPSITTAKMLFMQPRSLVHHTSKHDVVSKSATFSDSPTSRGFTDIHPTAKQPAPQLSSVFFNTSLAVVVPTVNGCAANFCVATSCHKHCAQTSVPLFLSQCLLNSVLLQSSYFHNLNFSAHSRDAQLIAKG